MTRRILLLISLLAVLALTAGQAGPVAADPSAGPAPRAVAATESAPVESGTPAAGTLHSSALAPDPGGSVSASAAWRIVTSPNKGAGDNHVHEVSCVNTTKCIGVGYSGDSVDGRRSLVLALANGTWKTQNVPQRGTSGNTLWNVSCVVGNRCYAVGYYADVAAGYYRTLIASYQGGFWSLVASPNMPNRHNFLFGVDCVDATHCVAVGRYEVTPLRFRTLILTLTGTTWQIVSSPNRSTTTANNFLADVSCGDATHCMAVGYSLSDAGVYQTLVLERNGTTWSLRSSRNVAGLSNLLRDVSCPTPTDCVAVGATDTATSANPNLPEVTLVERFAAGTWTIEPSPNRAGTDNHLWGVSCPSSTSCVAVGQSQQGTIKSWTLVATYDAGAWTQTPSPSRGGTFNFLYGISCPSASSCVSSGDYINLGSEHFRSLILTNS